MPLVNAKCTNCGANLKVDSAKDAAICEHCGSAYIVEKAVNNYNVQLNVNKNSDPDSLKILAYEYFNKKNYKKATKLFYEHFMLNHNNVLSKYMYQLSEGLVPMTDKELDIYYDFEHPRYEEINDREDRKKELGRDALTGLMVYYHDNKFIHNREEGEFILKLLVEHCNDFYDQTDMFLSFVGDIRQHISGNDRLQAAFLKIAEDKIQGMKLGVGLVTVPLQYSYSDREIDFSKQQYLRMSADAKKIAEFFPEITIPQELMMSEKDLDDITKSNSNLQTFKVPTNTETTSVPNNMSETDANAVIIIIILSSLMLLGMVWLFFVR